MKSCDQLEVWTIRAIPRCMRKALGKVVMSDKDGVHCSGHQIGSRAPNSEVAGALARNTREGIFPLRMYGKEFRCILEGSEPPGSHLGMSTHFP